jgi:cell division protease FtsH
MIDEEISKIVEGQYHRALHILHENRGKLDALAAKLLEKEVIFREDLEEIFGKRAWDPELTENPVSLAENAVIEAVVKEQDSSSQQ